MVAPVITAATAFIALGAVPVFPDFTIPIIDVYVPSIASDLKYWNSICALEMNGCQGAF